MLAPTFCLVSKREIKPGGQNNVVCLERRGARRLRRRIGHVNVAECILPCQPLADLRYRPEIECRMILSYQAGTEVGEEIQLLGKHSRRAQFLHELLSQSKRQECVRNR